MRDSDEIVCLTETAFLDACAAHGFYGVIPRPGLVVKTFRNVRIEFRPPAPPDPHEAPFRAWASSNDFDPEGRFPLQALSMAWKDGRKFGEASVDHRAQADLVEKGFGIAIDTLRLHSHHAAADLLRRLRP